MDSSAERDLEIRFFGDAVFRYRGIPHAFKAPPKTLPLLAYLLQHREPVSRDRLAAWLWPDEPEDVARTNVRRHLHYVSKYLPQSDVPWIVVDRRTVSWNRDASYWYDVGEFESAAGGHAGLDAVALYRDDFLPAVDDDWIFQERERLRNVHVANLEGLIRRAADVADYAVAHAYAQRLLRHDPYREDIVRESLRARIALGDRSGALAEFEQFRRLLEADLGADPMPETCAVLDAPPAEPAETPAPVALIGRDRELERLHTWWSRAKKNGPPVAIVSGEAGVGKTALVRAFTALLSGEARVLYGATTWAGGVPYQPFIDALRDGGDASFELREDATGSVFDRFAERFSAQAAGMPVIVVIEDLHWAAEATIDLFAALSGRLTANPVYFVATYREEEATAGHPLYRMRRTLEHLRRATTVALAPLAKDHVRALVRGSGGSEADAEQMFAASGGVPLFVTELLHAKREGVTGSAVPKSISDLCRLRLQTLSEGARAVIETAACVGSAFSLPLIAAVSGRSEGEAEAGTIELLERRLVTEDNADALQYSFRHDLIRAAVYDEIPENVRARRHGRIAAVLERGGHDDPRFRANALAYHLERSSDPRRAAPYYLQAAEIAAGAFALREALRFVDRGIELAQGDADLEARLLILRVPLHRHFLEYEPQIRDVRRLRALLPQLSSSVLRARSVLTEVAVASSMGVYALESARVAELEDIAASDSSGYSSFAVQLCRGLIALRSARLSESMQHLNAALALSAALPDEFRASAVVRTRVLQAHCALMREEPVTAYIEAARAAAVRHEHAIEVAFIEAFTAASTGRGTVLPQVTERLASIPLDADRPQSFARRFVDQISGLVPYIRLLAALYQGDNEEARRQLDVFEKAIAGSRDPGDLIRGAAMRALAAGRLNEFERQVREASAGLEIADRYGCTLDAFDLRLARIDGHLGLEHHDTCIELANDLLRDARALAVPFYEGVAQTELAIVYSRMQRYADAARHAAIAFEHVSRVGDESSASYMASLLLAAHGRLGNQTAVAGEASKWRAAIVNQRSAEHLWHPLRRLRCYEGMRSFAFHADADRQLELAKAAFESLTRGTEDGFRERLSRQIRESDVPAATVDLFFRLLDAR